jgi:hypothetical protein
VNGQIEYFRPQASNASNRVEEDPHEDGHLDEAEQAQVPEEDRPRVEERRLQIEEDEEQRDQVELHRHALGG